MSRLRGAVFLVLLAVAAAALLAWVYDLTAERIVANELAQRLAALRAVLPDGSYDNEPHLDAIFVTSAELLGAPEPVPAYRARRDGEPVAVVLTAIAPNGFTAAIRMLVGIDTDGRVIAVRVTSHKETPGLGDGIDADKSDWIDLFAGLQTENPLAREWILDKDGGRFDHMTGATITSHSVVNAVRNAVIYFNANRQELLSAGVAPQ